MQSNGLDLSRDGVGDVKNVAIRSGKAVAALAQRQTAEAGAAHLAFAELRKRRRVGTRHVLAAQRIRRAFEERHHGPALVVGFLNENLAEAVQDQTPDVARAPTDDLKLFAVRRETRELRLVVVRDFT